MIERYKDLFRTLQTYYLGTTSTERFQLLNGYMKLKRGNLQTLLANLHLDRVISREHQRYEG